MTRGSVPRIDLYEELEVSRLASVEVIEAAYRSLVKQHHPDVLPASDGERIKRLNLAREWLVDPVKRRRYDASRGLRGSAAGPSAATRADGSSASPDPRPGRGSSAGTGHSHAPRASSETSFGVNTPAVRQLLSDLRALDRRRAQQLWDGRAVAHARGYSAARRRAHEISRSERRGEWEFAREAASVIARGKLGDWTLTSQVVDVVADIAGTITISDLLARADFELLMLPWTWRGERAPLPASMKPASMKPDRPRTAAAARLAGPPAPEPPPAVFPQDGLAPETPISAPTTERPAVAPPLSARPLPPRGRSGTPAGRRAVASVHRGAIAARAGSLPLLYVVVVVMGLGGVIAAVNRPPGASAVDPAGQPSIGPSQVVAGVTAAPVAPPTARPATPRPTLDPARVRELQQGAARTLGSLAAAGAAGDVALVSELVGGSAPGLRASGLRAASFPEAAAREIAIERGPTGWIASVGPDRLTSVDGTAWTFDYADRPLARFTGASERRLFWEEADGRHELSLRVPSATLSRSGVSIRFAWTSGFGPESDPRFDGTRIEISSIVVGSREIMLVPGPAMTITAGARNGTVSVPGSFSVPARVEVRIGVSPLNDGRASSAGTVETSFELGSG